MLNNNVWTPHRLTPCCNTLLDETLNVSFNDVSTAFNSALIHPHPEPYQLPRKRHKRNQFPEPKAIKTDVTSLAPSITFRLLPPNSARLDYATERGTLHLSIKTVEATQHPSTRVNIRHIRPRFKKKDKKRSSISVQTFLVLFALAWATWAVIAEMPDILWVVWYKLTATWALTKKTVR